MRPETKIANLVIKNTGVNIFDKSRRQEVVDARCLFDYILRDRFNYTFQKIVDYYAKQGLRRHHATLIHSVRLWPDVSRRYPEYEKYLAEIIETELSTAQYQNAYELVNKLKTKKQLDQFRAVIQEIIG